MSMMSKVQVAETNEKLDVLKEDLSTIETLSGLKGYTMVAISTGIDIFSRRETLLFDCKNYPSVKKELSHQIASLKCDLEQENGERCSECGQYI